MVSLCPNSWMTRHKTTHEYVDTRKYQYDWLCLCRNNFLSPWSLTYIASMLAISIFFLKPNQSSELIENVTRVDRRDNCVTKTKQHIVVRFVCARTYLPFILENFSRRLSDRCPADLMTMRWRQSGSDHIVQCTDRWRSFVRISRDVTTQPATVVARLGATVTQREAGDRFPRRQAPNTPRVWSCALW